MLAVYKYAFYGGEGYLKKIVFLLIVFIVVTVNVFAMPDFSSVEENIGNGLVEDPQNIIEKILNNEIELDGETVIEKLFSLMCGAFKNVLPYLASLLSITIILSVTEKLKFISGKCENAMLLGGKIIFSVILIKCSMTFINDAKNSLEEISAFTQALLPILITLLASIGAQSTATMLGPSQVLLSTVLINVCVKIIFPIILVGFITTTINGILSDNKLKGFSDFMKNCSSWLMGGVFAIFSAIIALQGITTSITDGISIRSIKYAISSSIPIIGSSISENFSAVLLSAFSIKSASGIMGMIVIGGIVITPIINIWSFIILLNLFSACVHPFASEIIGNQIRNITEFLKLAAIVLLGVSVLWFVYLGIIIFAGGSFM